MPVFGDYFAFREENIAWCPTCPGVYSLHEGDETIYIGKADGPGGIRASLLAHKRGEVCRCSAQATAYCREYHTEPAARQQALLEEYRRTHGRLPRCNGHA